MRNHVDIIDTTEGPMHDPYGVEILSFTNLEGDTFTLKTSGIGYRQYTRNGAEVRREFEDEKPLPWEYSCEELFERDTGLTPDRARKIFYQHYVEDPMGGPGMYI